MREPTMSARIAARVLPLLVGVLIWICSVPAQGTTIALSRAASFAMRRHGGSGITGSPVQTPAGVGMLPSGHRGPIARAARGVGSV